METVGLKIKKFRLLANYTQAYVAHKLDVSERWYRDLEKGKNRIYLDQIVLLSKLLDFNSHELIPPL
jgi:transcriptional regulator with XRE-family HTH domain